LWKEHAGHTPTHVCLQKKELANGRLQLGVVRELNRITSEKAGKIRSWSTSHDAPTRLEFVSTPCSSEGTDHPREEGLDPWPCNAGHHLQEKD